MLGEGGVKGEKIYEGYSESFIRERGRGAVMRMERDTYFSFFASPSLLFRCYNHRVIIFEKHLDRKRILTSKVVSYFAWGADGQNYGRS